MPHSHSPDSALSLLVVVLNYRTAALTIDCLQSLVSEVPTVPNTRVVVTDNASGDGSAEKIAAAIDQHNWHPWAEIMPLERNGGFAYGNNAAVRPALASPNPPAYVLLLNPDTVVLPGALKALVDFMETHPQVGIAGSRLEDPDGTPQHSAFRFPTCGSELDQNLRLGGVSKLLSRWIVAPPICESPHPTDWVAGASMIIRPTVFEAIGLIDEGYFMYFEEVDFCLRAQRAGFPCWYVPQSRVVHLVGQSSGVTDTKRPAKRLPAYWFDSRRRFFLKNYGWLYTAATDGVSIAGFALWRARRYVQNKPDSDPPKALFDSVRHSVFIRGPRYES
jgi:N-acetylglucosaminyl-diphospho-decaprenol L-rhamnosyltransferase